MATTTSTTVAAQEASEFEAHWLEAKKFIRDIIKKLEQVDKDESGSKKLLAELEVVEHLLESLRLACMATTFTDFKSAHQHRVLDRLWHVHTLISAEYKKGLHRHRGHGQIVQFRTIEKQYAKHLKTAQYFYKGFIERLSARYQLRPLQRVAHSMQSSHLKMSDVIDAEDAQLSLELTVACYRTVLHMGDIARYRLNASRHKGHSPEVAMTYYALAQELMPKEGDAHHQMAVVLAEQRRDFDVVYHFLRAWSVQKPFALAPKNLASEYKKLLQPPSNSRKQGNAPPDAYEVFGSWLVRLHANYFKGETFSSQSELEREVLHRWEALLKKAEQPLFLQKAVLLSLAAYDTALRRVHEEWTAVSSQSCQFILQFIVRAILTITRGFETEAEHLLGDPASEDSTTTSLLPATAEEKPPFPRSHDNNEKHETNEKGQRCEKAARGGRNQSAGSDNKATITAATATAATATAATSPGRDNQAKGNSVPGTYLLLFRVCMAWISIHKEDLVKFEKYLEPYIADMHRSVTRCLTLSIDLITKTDASPTTYLLPEDVELIGLAPLDSWTALHEGDASSPYKPHFDEENIERKSLRYERMARLYDIVECTVDLVAYKSLPWAIKTLQVDGREITSITYFEERSSTLITSVPAAAPSASASYADDTNRIAPTADSSHANMQSPPTQASNNQCDASQPVHKIATPFSSVPFAPPPVTQPSQIAAQRAFGQSAAGQSIWISSVPPQDKTSTHIAPLLGVSYKDIDDDNFLPGSAKDSPSTSNKQNMIRNHRSSVEPSNSDLDLFDSAAYSRVANFLSPPELHNQPVQLNPLPPPSSYGMQTSTIEDVFGQLHTPSITGAPMMPSKTAGIAKQIPSSPWSDSIYLNSLGYHPQQQDVPYGPGGLNRPPSSIEDQLAYLTLVKQKERQTAALVATTSSATASSYGMDSLGRGFPSSLSPVGTLKQQQQQQQSQSKFANGGNLGGIFYPWAVNSNSGSSNPDESSRLVQRQVQAVPLGDSGNLSVNDGIGRGGSQQHNGSSPAMLYSSNFSMNHTMPPVQSPGGIEFNGKSSSLHNPMSVGKQQLQQTQHYMQAQQRLEQNTSTGAVYGGYGSVRAAPVPSLWQDFWNRETPREDDSTHFRNSVRHSGLMDETNAYDRNVLLSALVDKNGHS
ncbi:hypothetical protein SEPCBS119000_001229 [Sporothrix epigloea]|uniref:Nonsense-mediated mRNA decay factor n=1 Tax=Sporothrix epigloea TaxID=1892477 RepID=A0ABP0DB63_9PEZI